MQSSWAGESGLPIGISSISLPGLDQPEAAYMKDLFEQAIARSKTAMVDLDCLAPIRRFSAEIEAGAGGTD